MNHKLPLVLILIMICGNLFGQQNLFVNQKMVTIANFENNTPILVNFSNEFIDIETKISNDLKLDRSLVNLQQAELVNDPLTGWHLQYRFFTQDIAGIYKENLQFREDKLVITEYRIAKMAIANNCSEIKFTNNEDKCECMQLIDSNRSAELKFAVFSSVN